MLQRRNDRVLTVTATSGAHAQAMAHRLVADGVDALVVLGGDGTVGIALQAVAGSATALGIVPLGTGNDNAASLGLPVGNLRDAVAVIRDGHVRAIDAARARTADGEQRLFLGVLSSGFDAMVNERSQRLLALPGRSRYLAALAAELRSFRPVDFEIDIDGARLSGPAMFTAIGNGSRYGGGMRVCEGARMDDGLLTMTWIHPLPALRFVQAFPRVYRGTHTGLPQVSQHVGRRFVVRAPGQVAYADGERVGPLPVEVEVLPGAVRMLLPAQGS
jgi:diacylglycerol kinase (ATP)